ncbi:MAG: hypothetical protein KH338_11220, partial [Oscillospiraceae bacterium]|nr:hypothetical protein [Oscillospiraceae bacterium]
MAEQQGTDSQAIQGLWEVDQQEPALPRDGGSPAAQKEPALSPEANIAIFKIKAYSRMNGTNLHSPVELQPEMHAESHL